MISVSTHPVDLAAIRAQDVPRELAGIERARSGNATAGVELEANHLGAQASGAYKAVDLFTADDPTRAELLALARFFTRASAALFTYRRRPERSRWRLREHDLEIAGTADDMYYRSSVWQQAFWLAFGLRDACSLALLLQTPTGQIAVVDGYERPMIAAIQSTFARQPGTGAKLVEALELADPDKAPRTWPAAMLDLIVPVFEPLLALADRDENRFTASLQKLLELRREYYLREKYDEGEKWDGRDRDNLSVEAVGLIAWARTLGMTIEVDSGYAPKPLLDVATPEIEACRLCVTPSDDADPRARCHACDATREGTLAFSFADWVALDRAPCRSCEHPFPMIAKICPVCLTSRRGG